MNYLSELMVKEGDVLCLTKLSGRNNGKYQPGIKFIGN